MSYGTSLTVDLPFADAVDRVRGALRDQGFGVLTEIDVTETLRADEVGRRLAAALATLKPLNSRRQAMDSSVPGTGIHVSFRTMCGREIRIGHLVLGGGRHPARRVSLDIGASPAGGTGTWAGLTSGEARRLAAALLMQAAACDGRPPGG